jgi:hypothetical protein
MKEQHKNMIKELIAGRHTQGEEVAPVPGNETATPEQQAGQKNQIAKSLDDILLDYIIKRNE